MRYGVGWDVAMPWIWDMRDGDGGGGTEEEGRMLDRIA